MNKTIPKTSMRFFNEIPVRSVWDNESSKWWCAAMYICQALTSSKNPRSYGMLLEGETRSCQQFVDN